MPRIKRPAAFPNPISLPQGLTRADCLAYICEAIEGDQGWAAKDETIQGLLDALAKSGDIFLTLRTFLPDAEWREAFLLIASKAPHHEAYKPRRSAPTHPSASEYPEAAEIAQALAQRTGRKLSANDYVHWMEPLNNAAYERFDKAARKALGTPLYEAAEQAARLAIVLEVALGREVKPAHEQRLAEALIEASNPGAAKDFMLR